MPHLRVAQAAWQPRDHCQGPPDGIWRKTRSSPITAHSCQREEEWAAAALLTRDLGNAMSGGTPQWPLPRSIHLRQFILSGR
jgi:hypothetical protein